MSFVYLLRITGLTRHVQMPNLDGLQSTRLIREMGYSAPIVALTAFAEESNVKECRLTSGRPFFMWQRAWLILSPCRHGLRNEFLLSEADQTACSETRAEDVLCNHTRGRQRQSSGEAVRPHGDGIMTISHISSPLFRPTRLCSFANYRFLLFVYCFTPDIAIFEDIGAHYRAICHKISKIM